VLVAELLRTALRHLARLSPFEAIAGFGDGTPIQLLLPWK
jgi:hypothetical protein